MQPMTARTLRGSDGERLASLWAALAGLAVLAACGTTEFVSKPAIPEPLVEKIPVVVGVYIPAEFREQVHREKRNGAAFAISLGAGQANGFQRLLDAMFVRTVPVPAADAGARTDPAIRGVLEPVLEEFAFITPAEAGSNLYAVSVKYRINGYTPTGQLIDSWRFTGYGTQAAGSLGTKAKEALQQATALAIRDAAAKLATELRDQAVIRGLLPGETGQAPVELVPPGQ